MVQKNDIRSRYSQGVIKNAVLRLLLHKPLGSITVREVCDACQINRGTFYNHFADIRDVYECIEADFFADVQLYLDRVDVFRFDAALFTELLNYFQENDAIATLVRNSGPDSLLMAKVHALIREKVLSAFRERYGHVDEERLLALFSYIVGGTTALFVRLCKERAGAKANEKGGEAIATFTNVLLERNLPSIVGRKAD